MVLIAESGDKTNIFNDYDSCRSRRNVHRSNLYKRKNLHSQTYRYSGGDTVNVVGSSIKYNILPMCAVRAKTRNSKLETFPLLQLVTFAVIVGLYEHKSSYSIEIYLYIYIYTCIRYHTHAWFTVLLIPHYHRRRRHCFDS